MSELRPIIKWAGGKTQILSVLLSNIPTSYNTYYEPFLGGATLLFSLQPKKSVINDINPQLINLYKYVRDDINSLIQKISDYDMVPCSKTFYLEQRDLYNEKIKNNKLDLECASLFLWLNKHCFNGLYRVNRSGLFNVSYNNKISGTSIDINNIKSVSSYLCENNVTILNEDFISSCSSVREGDFVYFDSPYIPESITSNFTSYTSLGFSMDDHIRLCDLFKSLDSIGAKVMLSNNDVPLIYDMYKNYNIKSFEVKRMINRDSSKRKGREVIITNY